MTDATPLMDYCEALRFATSLRTAGWKIVRNTNTNCEALRFATSLRNHVGRLRLHDLALRSFTLRNFIEDRKIPMRTSWSSYCEALRFAFR